MAINARHSHARKRGRATVSDQVTLMGGSSVPFSLIRQWPAETAAAGNGGAMPRRTKARPARIDAQTSPTSCPAPGSALRAVRVQAPAGYPVITERSCLLGRSESSLHSGPPKAGPGCRAMTAERWWIKSSGTGFGTHGGLRRRPGGRFAPMRYGVGNVKNGRGDDGTIRR